MASMVSLAKPGKRMWMHGEPGTVRAVFARGTILRFEYDRKRRFVPRKPACESTPREIIVDVGASNPNLETEDPYPVNTATREQSERFIPSPVPPTPF